MDNSAVGLRMEPWAIHTLAFINNLLEKNNLLEDFYNKFI